MWNGTLAELAGFSESPTSDGILCDWVRKRATAPFTVADVAPIATLLGREDPHLQEAAVDLATAALRTLDAAAQLEPPLVALATLDSDSYVLEALVELLESHDLAALFAALERIEPRVASPPSVAPRARRTRYILRNRMPEPWRRFRELATRR
jgi:hypothetical protein